MGITVTFTIAMGESAGPRASAAWIVRRTNKQVTTIRIGKPLDSTELRLDARRRLHQKSSCSPLFGAPPGPISGGEWRKKLHGEPPQTLGPGSSGVERGSERAAESDSRLERAGPDHGP